MAPLSFTLSREPFAEEFVVQHADGQSEQLSPDELRKWIKDRGGDPDKLESIMDYCWNFPWPQTVVIANPRPVVRGPLDPQLGQTV